MWEERGGPGRPGPAPKNQSDPPAGHQKLEQPGRQPMKEARARSRRYVRSRAWAASLRTGSARARGARPPHLLELMIRMLILIKTKMSIARQTVENRWAFGPTACETPQCQMVSRLCYLLPQCQKALNRGAFFGGHQNSEMTIGKDRK